MNKKEIIKTVANKYEGYTQKEIGEIIDVFLGVVQDQLVAGETVRLSGFGNFEVATRAARMGRNPQTGAEIEIPEKKAPKFKPAKALKDAVDA